MTRKEYDDILVQINACKIAVKNMDRLAKKNKTADLKSLLPDDFATVMTEALDLYKTYAVMKVRPMHPVLPENFPLEPFLNWCRETGHAFTEEDYQIWKNQTGQKD